MKLNFDVVFFFGFNVEPGATLRSRHQVAPQVVNGQLGHCLPGLIQQVREKNQRSF